MVWSRVSNAADMSRAVRIVIFPESIVSMMSFVNLSRAVSVEWNLRYRQTAKGRNWEIWIYEEKDELGQDVRAFCQ